MFLMLKKKESIMGMSTSMEDSVRKGWEITGNTDLWQLLCKAVNHDTGEYHSTKVLRLESGGAVLQCDSMVSVKGTLQFRRSMLVLPDVPMAPVVG